MCAVLVAGNTVFHELRLGQESIAPQLLPIGFVCVGRIFPEFALIPHACRHPPYKHGGMLRVFILNGFMIKPKWPKLLEKTIQLFGLKVMFLFSLYLTEK